MKSLVSMVKICAAFAALSFGITANAETLTVTSTGDDASDATTLRGAIAAAADGDTIDLSGLAAGSVIKLTTAQGGALQPTKSLTIVGREPTSPTSGYIAIDGQNADFPLVYSTDANVDLVFRNIELKNGKVSHNSSYNTQSASSAFGGPPIAVAGALTIENAYIHDNQFAQKNGYSKDMSDSDGGGVIRVGGDLSLSNCIFTANHMYGSAYSIGGVIAASGEHTIITDCVITNNTPWSTDKGYQVRSGGAIAILGTTVSSVRIANTNFERSFAAYGAPGIHVRSDVAATSFAVRNCVFRGLNGTSWNDANAQKGTALCYEGSASTLFLFENCEFSANTAVWGGAVRIGGSNASVVFANCTFARNLTRIGDAWGAAVDTRCLSYFVNCTIAGNVANSSKGENGSVFVYNRHHYFLNTVVAFNYVNNGSERRDLKNNSGHLYMYTVCALNAPTLGGTADNVMTYTDDTSLFAGDLEDVSALYYTNSTATTTLQTHSLATTVKMPAMPTIDADEPCSPGVIEITKDSVLHAAGYPVKHSADWSSIAYYAGGSWNALCGTVADATEHLSADSRGEAYVASNGLPVPPIGAATVPAYTITWDVATNDGQWSDETTDDATSSVYEGASPSAPENPVKSGCNFLGWNTDPTATTALEMSTIVVSEDMVFYAIFEEIASTDAVVYWFDEDGVTALAPASTLVAEGERPTHVEPTKDPDAQYTYAFAGWQLVEGGETVYATDELPVVAGGETLNYKAVYTPDVREYAVVFKDKDGNTISSAEYPYGTSSSDIDIPTVETSEEYEYTYTFANWDATVSNVVGEATYTAVYSVTANTIALETGNYKYSRELTIAGYDGTGTLTNFPVLVRMTNGSGGFDASTVSDSSEIRFADADGNMIPHEVDTWNAEGESTIWVSVPLISGTSTKFKMYWSPIGGEQQTALTASRVWTQAGYLGVWHFSPATDNVYANSAQAEHYATASAAGTEGTDGVVGGYVQFASGATTFVNNSKDWVDYTTHMTCEFWVDRQDKGDARIFGSGASYDQGASIYMAGYISGNGIHCVKQESLIPTSGWRHVSVNFSGTDQANALADGETAYTFWQGGGTSIDGNNGHFFHNVNDGSTFADYHALSLTSHGDGSELFKGYADEFRLRGENSTAEWMQANYDTQAPSTDFLTYGNVKKRLGLILFVR